MVAKKYPGTAKHVTGARRQITVCRKCGAYWGVGSYFAKEHAKKHGAQSKRWVK